MLRAGDRLQKLNGDYVVVEQIQHELLETPTYVYNFTVEDNHSYFVGYDEIGVHNGGCGKFNLANRGHSGRSDPLNLKEDLALQTAKADPLNGHKITSIHMNDPRWPETEGWFKYSQNINGIEIHYVLNVILNLVDDFKIK